MKSIKIKDLIKRLEKQYDPGFAESWDNVGLIFGNYENHVDKILLSLDLNYNIIEEAVKLNCNLIITHHPFIFRPINKINSKEQPFIYNILKQLYINNISVYTMHTNLDRVYKKLLARKFGLKSVMEFGEDIHGAYGDLNSRISVKKLISEIRVKLGVSDIRIAGVYKDSVKKIGFIGGAGAFIIKPWVKELDIDVIVTSDIKFHDAQEAERLGFMVIDAGHYFTEKIMIEELYKLIKRSYDKTDVNFFLSEIDTNSFIKEEEI